MLGLSTAGATGGNNLMKSLPPFKRFRESPVSKQASVHIQELTCSKAGLVPNGAPAHNEWQVNELADTCRFGRRVLAARSCTRMGVECDSMLPSCGDSGTCNEKSCGEGISHFGTNLRLGQ